MGLINRNCIVEIEPEAMLWRLMLTLRDWAFPLKCEGALDRSSQNWPLRSLRWVPASVSTAEWHSLTSLHSTPPVTWSAWRVRPFWFSLTPQNELTFVAKSPIRWQPLSLSQKFEWFSWPWHLGHLRSHEAMCTRERNLFCARLTSSAPILIWFEVDNLLLNLFDLFCEILNILRLIFCLSLDLVLLFLELLCSGFVDVLYVLWQDPFEHDVFLNDIFWGCCSLIGEGWTHDSLWLPGTQWLLLTTREMTAWHHQMRSVEEHGVPDDREQTYWHLLLPWGGSPIWTSFSLLMMMWLSSSSLTWWLLWFCVFFLTSSATMSKLVTKCPTRMSMTRITHLQKQDDQIWLLIWIWTFEVCMHLSMRHMTMTSNETIWWRLWVAWQPASFDLSQWGSIKRQWGWYLIS